jgi:DNA-binding MarR family transcriptional regulator
MKSPLKKELVRSVFRFKSIGMTFPTNINNENADVNLAEIALMKGIADKTLDSDMAKIQEGLCVKKAAVSQMLGVLEKKGYVNRETNKANRRKIILALTQKGETLIKETEIKVDNVLTEIISRFGEKETRQLIRLSSRFADIVSELRKSQKPSP